MRFVFNTPNAKSRPGYLKMGWQEIGRAGACVRPLSLGAGVRLVRSRVSASHWSERAEFGQTIDSLLADPGIGALLAARAADPDRFRTRCDHAFLAWRYGAPLLQYRAVLGPRGVDDGVAIVRIRRRGDAREAVVASVLVPAGSARAKRALVREVCRAVRPDADYLLGVGSIPGMVPRSEVRADHDDPRPRRGGADRGHRLRPGAG